MAQLLIVLRSEEREECGTCGYPNLQKEHPEWCKMIRAENRRRWIKSYKHRIWRERGKNGAANE